MRGAMRPIAPATLCCILAAPAVAGDLGVTVEIPRLNVAEYHRPYVAVWIEDTDQKVAANLAVWYDTELKNNEGAKWLKDMRQWWRRIGRQLDMPIDGVTGPTRPAGVHDVDVTHEAEVIEDLPPGEYALVVEAAREVGGREILRIPFQWPPMADASLTESGTSELGRVTLKLSP